MSNMLPPNSVFYAADGAFPNIVFGCDHSQKARISADRVNLFSGKFNLAVSLSVINNAVPYFIRLISGWRIPAKIFQTIIRGISVVMAAFQSLWPSANKCVQNQSVGREQFRFCAIAQQQKWPFMDLMEGKLFKLASFNIADTTEVRNFVARFVINDWKPCFHVQYMAN